MMIVIVGDCTAIVIEILVTDRLSVFPGAGRKRRRRSEATSSHNLKRRQVISTKN
jgi:hypothetical protein